MEKMDNHEEPWRNISEQRSVNFKAKRKLTVVLDGESLNQISNLNVEAVSMKLEMRNKNLIDGAFVNLHGRTVDVLVEPEISKCLSTIAYSEKNDLKKTQILENHPSFFNSDLKENDGEWFLLEIRQNREMENIAMNFKWIHMDSFSFLLLHTIRDRNLVEELEKHHFDNIGPKRYMCKHENLNAENMWPKIGNFLPIENELYSLHLMELGEII